MSNENQTTYKGYTITIEQDEDVTSPRIDCDNLGHMACFHRRANYGDNYKNRPDYCYDANDFQEWKKEHDGEVALTLPIYAYDHGNIHIYTETNVLEHLKNAARGLHCQWDSGVLGCIYVLKSEVRAEYKCERISKKTLAKVQACLISEIEVYSQYCEGDVYWYKVEDADGNEVDSCGGMFGYDYCMKEAKAAADYAATPPS